LSLEESVVVVPSQCVPPGERATSTALRSPDSSERRSPLPGVPGAIRAAAVRYWAAFEEHARRGRSKEVAHERILEEAEAEGGVARPSETINLTLWSESLGIPRPILEALVLAAYRRRAVPLRVPPASFLEGGRSDAEPGDAEPIPSRSRHRAATTCADAGREVRAQVGSKQPSNV
jgi:hypothetical protein